MSDEQDARRAAAAGMLGGDEETFRELLQSIVDVARTIFGARASSIFLLDEEADQLVFEAVSGEGEDVLVGTRFPSSTGIAGFALVTRQPLVVDDLDYDPRFARDRARETGYVPTSIVASPLLHDERALGVISVLDRGAGPPLRARGARAALALLDPGRDRARPPAPRPSGARRAGRQGKRRRSSRESHRCSTTPTTMPAGACSSRSSAFSPVGARRRGIRFRGRRPRIRGDAG